jgi:hypothetical protein
MRQFIRGKYDRSGDISPDPPDTDPDSGSTAPPFHDDAHSRGIPHSGQYFLLPVHSLTAIPAFIGILLGIFSYHLGGYFQVLSRPSYR